MRDYSPVKYYDFFWKNEDIFDMPLTLAFFNFSTPFDT